jgi:hypothetical protein
MPLAVTDTADMQLQLSQLKAERAAMLVKLKGLLALVLFYRELVKILPPVKTGHVPYLRKRMLQLIRFENSSGLHGLLWRYLPFTRRQWAAWNATGHCLRSLHNQCRKQRPQQLSGIEQETIKKACGDKLYEYWPLSSIYYDLLRQETIGCSLSTFYKYCRLMGITRKQLRKPKAYHPLLAGAPLKMLHQDITIFRTVSGVKHYLYIIRDNYSRAILACSAATEYSSKLAKQVLEQVLTQYGLMEQRGTLITDDGAENKGALDAWLNCKYP